MKLFKLFFIILLLYLRLAAQIDLEVISVTPTPQSMNFLPTLEISIDFNSAVDIAAINKRVILVARDLSPAETSQINLERVMGFVTDRGGKASHTGIIAQTLEIPAVVGLGAATAPRATTTDAAGRNGETADDAAHFLVGQFFFGSLQIVDLDTCHGVPPLWYNDWLFCPH